MVCKYTNIFGKVKTGVHAYRCFGLAIVDLVATFVAAVAIHYCFLKLAIWKIFAILMILAIIVHRIFCVNTTLNVLIFGKI
jgi:hypothetical protein